MSKLIYNQNEGMGSFHWETKAHVSQGNKEVSFSQIWFEDSKVISAQNVVMCVDELREILRRIDRP